MKLKYYLRGLGVGIVVTCIFLVVYIGNHNKAMTDEEVIARAKELGMIENTVLKEPVNDTIVPDDTTLPNEDATTPVDNTSITGDDAVTPGDDAVTPDDGSAIPDDTVTPEDTTIPAQDKIDTENITTPGEGTDNQESTNDETVSLTISRGEASYTVSKHLADLGAVDDAKAFDQYLSQNGYDKKILTGAHLIPIGVDYKAVAEAITSYQDK